MKLAALADEFVVAKSQGHGSDDLAEVAREAATGRVATLLIEADRRFTDPLADLDELVVKMGGRVLIIPSRQMPGRTGLAASYRY